MKLKDDIKFAITGYGSHCVSAGRPDRNPGMLCGCGSGDSGCAECGCCRTCAREDGDIAGAAAALNSEKGRLRDRLIRMEYLAAETKERYLGPGESEKFIRRRMQKMGNCRRSRRYTEKREGRRESELLKALESSMNKVRTIFNTELYEKCSNQKFFGRTISRTFFKIKGTQCSCNGSFGFRSR